MEQMLIITGAMGAGKTAVLGEASDLLTERQIPHAAIDADMLGLGYLASPGGTDSVMYDNLRSICENYAAVGVRRFLLARAIEDATQMKLCRDLFPLAKTVVCRLSGNVKVMKRRVEMRESGIKKKDYVARVEKLKAILDQARLENFTVTNEGRRVTEVAVEVLVKAGWI